MLTKEQKSALCSAFASQRLATRAEVKKDWDAYKLFTDARDDCLRKAGLPDYAELSRCNREVQGTQF